MFGIGTQEIIFIVLIVLLFFGGKKIPELMKGLGKGVRSFKEGVKGVENDQGMKIRSKRGTCHRNRHLSIEGCLFHRVYAKWKRFVVMMVHGIMAQDFPAEQGFYRK